MEVDAGDGSTPPVARGPTPSSVNNDASSGSQTAPQQHIKRQRRAAAGEFLSQVPCAILILVLEACQKDSRLTVEPHPQGQQIFADTLIQ